MPYVGHAAQLVVLAGATLLIVKSSEFQSRFRQTSAVSMTLLYVPLSVVAGGVATSILDLSVPDSVLGDIAIVCAQVVPLVAITHLVAMLQRVFTASVGQLQQALRVSHRRFWSAMAVHGALSIVCFIVGAYTGPNVALSSPPPASAGALCGAAIFAVNVVALLFVAFTFQYCELSPISKLKDRLAKNQRSAKQVAFACVVVHAPLLTWTIARACGVEPVSMSGAIWRGSFWVANLILQAVAMGIFNASGRKEGSNQPSTLHQNAENNSVASDTNEDDEDKPQN